MLSVTDDDAFAAGYYGPAAGLDDGAHEVVRAADCCWVAPGLLGGIIDGLLDGGHVFRWDIAAGDDETVGFLAGEAEHFGPQRAQPEADGMRRCGAGEGIDQ